MAIRARHHAGPQVRHSDGHPRQAGDRAGPAVALRGLSTPRGTVLAALQGPLGMESRRRLTVVANSLTAYTRDTVPILKVHCRKCGKLVSTGLDMSREVFESATLMEHV